MQLAIMEVICLAGDRGFGGNGVPGQRPADERGREWPGMTRVPEGHPARDHGGHGSAGVPQGRLAAGGREQPQDGGGGGQIPVWMGSLIAPALPPQWMGDGNGQLGPMLLALLPTSSKGEILANRATSSAQVLFRIFTRYQPGGLGERAMLLRQLVDPRTPTSMLEALEQLRAWKRYLRRAQELKIATPDATLLVGALEKYVGVIVKASPQTSFRLNSARAGLRIDVAPVVDSVLQFADVVLAEAEAGFHSTAQGTAAKVKAMVAGNGGSPDKTSGKGGGKSKDGGGKDAATAPVCRFFLTDGGCKKGADCTYKHEFDGDKRGRCWNCGGTLHTFGKGWSRTGMRSIGRGKRHGGGRQTSGS